MIQQYCFYTVCNQWSTNLFNTFRKFAIEFTGTRIPTTSNDLWKSSRLRVVSPRQMGGEIMFLNYRHWKIIWLLHIKYNKNDMWYIAVTSIFVNWQCLHLTFHQYTTSLLSLRESFMHRIETIDVIILIHISTIAYWGLFSFFIVGNNQTKQHGRRKRSCGYR